MPEENTPVPAESKAPAVPKPINLTKIVITLKGNNAVIGVQADRCDPYWETVVLPRNMASDIADALPEVVENALAKWTESKTNPKFTGQLPSQVKPPAPAPRPAATSQRQPAVKPTVKPAEPARPLQGSMF